MSDTHVVLHNPDGLLKAAPPLDRAPHEALVTAVLAWNNNPDLAPATTSRSHSSGPAPPGQSPATSAAPPTACPGNTRPEHWPTRSCGRPNSTWSTGLEGTVRCVQDRARLVRTVYERLDRPADTTRPVPAAADGGEIR
ncbi:restriction endonuclease [Streptomyces uncialis]|uniref:restriction endonuclease n=1 Tax=Streptomyces uncialis TaxID=1048205 RepID=UPI0037A0020E